MGAQSRVTQGGVDLSGFAALLRVDLRLTSSPPTM